MIGLVGGPLLVGGLEPGPPTPPPFKSGPAIHQHDGQTDTERQQRPRLRIASRG